MLCCAGTACDEAPGDPPATPPSATRQDRPPLPNPLQQAQATPPVRPAVAPSTATQPLPHLPGGGGGAARRREQEATDDFLKALSDRRAEQLVQQARNGARGETPCERLYAMATTFQLSVGASAEEMGLDIGPEEQFLAACEDMPPQIVECLLPTADQAECRQHLTAFRTHSQ